MLRQPMLVCWSVSPGQTVATGLVSAMILDNAHWPKIAWRSAQMDARGAAYMDKQSARPLSLQVGSMSTRLLQRRKLRVIGRQIVALGGIITSDV